MNNLKIKLRKMGSLRDMQQAARLVMNWGYTITGVDGLTIYVMDHGAVKFEERGDRIWPQ